MASLRRHPRSPYLFAVFTLPNGVRTNRSTGTSDRRKAQRIANEWEDTARTASEGRLIESRARKTISDICDKAGITLSSSTVGDFLESWLEMKALEVGAGSHERYKGVVDQFKAFLGGKVKRDISQITSKDISKFRDHLANRVAPGTVNISLKILRGAFAQAKRDGLVDVNEFERVSLIKRPKQSERRAFTLPELRRILEVASDEWKGVIMFGIYTGQRLGDIASLTWTNVDLIRGEVSLSTIKTDRQQIIPLAPPLLRYLESLTAGDDPSAPLFPKIAATVERHGRTGNLSNQFYDILVAAGLAKKRSHRASKNGRSAKRDQNEVSFHSLRHTATSLLKSAGVSDAVAMEFVGHDSASISRNYTHIETSALKSAADKLPDVLA